MSGGQRPRALLSALPPPPSVHDAPHHKQTSCTQINVQEAEAEKLLKRRNPRALGRAVLSAAGDALCKQYLRYHTQVPNTPRFSYLLQVVSQPICPGTKEELLCLGI